MKSVVAALRSLIGRRPKSAVEAILENDVVKQAYDQMALPRRDIETEIADKALAQRFMDRVIAQWHALGESEPYWSNDTSEELKGANLNDAAIEAFYADGATWMPVLAAFESRCDVSIANGRCLELGAGVGKHTGALARRFAHVTAVDVSAGGLAVCAARAKATGLTNVTTALLTSIGDFAGYGQIDFFVSLSTLQHNPPPVQRMLLNAALDNLVPGGFCLFQTPDWLDGYSFSSARFLAASEAMFDLHCLPKPAVLDILESNGMRLLDFAPDFTVGSFGSYTYFAEKRL